MKYTMSQKFLHVLLSICFAVEIVSGTTVISRSPSTATPVLTSSTATETSVQSSSSPSTATAVLTSSTPTEGSVKKSISPSGSTPSLSSVTSTGVSGQTTTSSVQSSSLSSSTTLNLTATTSSVFPSPAKSTPVILPSASPSSVQASAKSTSSILPSASPSAVQPSASAVPQPTKQTTTSDTGAKGKTLGPLEGVGIALVAVLALLLISFGIYYFVFRKRMNPEPMSQPMVEARVSPDSAATAQTAWAEVGITHQTFVGDSDSPTNLAAPGSEVKPAEPEVKSEVQDNEATEENANFSEDSAL